nr:DMT family transporter [Curvibacter sp. CHRR-16]
MVVLAALIHATWNLLAKRAASAGAAFVFAYTAFSLVLYAPWVVYLLWQGQSQWSGPIVACIAVSGVLQLAYTLLLQRGYQVADLSVVYPVARGTGPLMSTVGAFVLLGESASWSKAGGLLAIVAGIVLITTQGSMAKFRQPAAYKGLQWGGMTGVTIAGYTVVDAYAVKVLGIVPVVLDWCACLLRLVALLPWVLRNRAEVLERMRGYWLLAAVVGALCPMAYILVLLALKQGAPLSFVAPAREMSMMMGALLGMLVLREPVGLWRLVGCLTTIGGVLLLGATAH